MQVICKILCHKCANYISDLSMEKMQLLKIYSPRILHTEGVNCCTRSVRFRGGVVLFKALNFGKDVCGLYGVKYARTFGCLITFFNVHLSVLFSAQSVTQVSPCLSYPCCVFSLYINRPLPLKTFTQRSNYIAYILTCKMYTQSVQYLPAKWDQFLQVECIRQQQQKGRSDFRTTLFFISVP